MASFYDNCSIQVRKGTLELCILNALEKGECYSHMLVKQLVALHVTESTIYPLPSRLKIQELVATQLEESPDGPGHKYYKITRNGSRERMNRYYRSLTHAVVTLLTTASSQLFTITNKSLTHHHP